VTSDELKTGFQLVTCHSSLVTVSVNLALFRQSAVRRTASQSKGKAMAARGSKGKRFRPMAISPDLLEILACPACKAKVELQADGSRLKCPECKRVYPIRDDIPVMLIDEAVVEDEEPQA
jgi:uncharacterized protein YbaR (Trm112 family)